MKKLIPILVVGVLVLSGLGAVAISEVNENKLIAYRKHPSGLKINIECGPEELLSRLMIVGKAIREWENAMNKLADLATGIKP